MSTQDLDERRIEEAHQELGATQVRPGVARAVVGVFLLSLAMVPLIEAVGPREPLPVFGEERVLCSLRGLERRLDEDTRVARALRPFVQTAFLRAGAGNAQVYVGRDGWLFQREAVASVTGPAFGAPHVMQARIRGADECAPVPHPDARAAVVAFHEALEARGVHLVVLPTPAKASVTPDRLSGRFAPDAAGPRNAGFAAFLAGLEAEGVHVVDTAPVLRALGPGSRYLATDTHWQPAAVEAVAELVADELEARAGLSPPSLALRRERAAVTNRGDVAVLLGALPGAVALEQVDIHPVVTGSGEPWSPAAGAEVLLLGDSFSNVYSDRAAFARDSGRYDWGAGAGLAEQLAFALQRPVDRIVRNDDGAFATRLDLARAVGRAAGEGRDRLAGVRAVVWQFAERELAFGDWRAVELPPAPVGAPVEGPLPAVERRTVRGTIAARAPTPAPGSTPYPDALFALRLVEVEVLDGPAAPAELLVYLQGLRGNRRTPEDARRVGERVELEIVGWSDGGVQARVGGLARTELDDDDALLLPAFWGESSR